MLQLAKEFGRADVSNFLGELSSSQITEWLAYFKAESEMMEKSQKKPSASKKQNTF
jgi:hypothetical protein